MSNGKEAAGRVETLTGFRAEAREVHGRGRYVRAGIRPAPYPDRPLPRSWQPLLQRPGDRFAHLRGSQQLGGIVCAFAEQIPRAVA